ncbi:MAG: hypothetical protein ACR2RB_04035 [Gammaproteobacteria bacterium]
MSKKRTLTLSKGKTDGDQVGTTTDEQIRAEIEGDPEAPPNRRKPLEAGEGKMDQWVRTGEPEENRKTAPVCHDPSRAADQ